MKRMSWPFFLAVSVSLALSGWWIWQRAVPKPTPPALPRQSLQLPKTCSDRIFEGVSYIVCEVDTARYTVQLYLNGSSGKPYERMEKVAAEHVFLFAMNAGMYHEDFSPVGLYVDGGKELAPLNRGDAPGNFFMKPNGVFYIDKTGGVGVMETSTYAASGIVPRIATQSGPMLVIDGVIHPKFEPNGQSRYIRNGVGVRENQTAYFAISLVPVSLGSFARLFRDELHCKNALFFDGAVSALHDGKDYVIGGAYPAGPIVAVSEKTAQ